MTLFTPTYPDGLPIGDGWVPTPDESQILFPFTGETVSTAPLGTQQLAIAAIDAAFGVRKTVGNMASRTRRELLKQTVVQVSALSQEFEQLLVLETGKPLRDCQVEVARTLVTLETAAEEVARLHGETVPLDLLPTGDGMIGFWQHVR